MSTWQDKANRLIGNLCADAYRRANPKPSRRHVPYTVPTFARELLDCLNAGDELRDKSLFHTYDGLKACTRDPIGS